MTDSRPADQRTVRINQTVKKSEAIRSLSILILLASAAIGLLTADEFGAGETRGTTLKAIGCGVGMIIFGVGIALLW